jgi:hypothetical protein
MFAFKLSVDWSEMSRPEGETDNQGNSGFVCGRGIKPMGLPSEAVDL